jgi:hypothetical protein
MGNSRIGELASAISDNTSKIEQYLEHHNLPSPSFGVDAPSNLGIPSEASDIEAAKRAALEATAELQDLLASTTALLLLNVPTAFPSPYTP